MSINMDAGGETDYSDFEYQTIQFSLTAEKSNDDSTTNNNIQVNAVGDSEVLGGIGGLDNNEVAELVYLETHAQMEYEDESADQNIASGAEMRGAVGVNLPKSDESLPGNRPGTTFDVADEPNGIAAENVSVIVRDSSEDRFLQQYQTASSPPFDDQTNGPGGNASYEQFYAEKNYRAVTGRGPVLDANDDISISGNLVIGDSVIDVSGVVRCHLIWDVAETSDAGRRFSVPMDD